MKKKQFLLALGLVSVVLFVWMWRSQKLFLRHSSNSESTAEYQASSSPESGLINDTVHLGQASPSRVDLESSEKLKVLESILSTQNDNDPRMDRELRLLIPRVEDVFREKYRSIPLEKRNDRGTIVFLLGRNLDSSEDFIFLQEVASEPPCLSLQDCSTEVKSTDPHAESGMDVTLAYPQIITLKALEKYLSKAGVEKPAYEADAHKTLQVAKNSKNPMVSKVATELERKYFP